MSRWDGSAIRFEASIALSNALPKNTLKPIASMKSRAFPSPITVAVMSSCKHFSTLELKMMSRN